MTDLVVAANGDAAWIATLRGRPGRATVWVRSGGRVQAIDQARIDPTSLVLTDGETGVDYVGSDGGTRNPSFG